MAEISVPTVRPVTALATEELSKIPQRHGWNTGYQHPSSMGPLHSSPAAD